MEREFSISDKHPDTGEELPDLELSLMRYKKIEQLAQLFISGEIEITVEEAKNLNEDEAQAVRDIRAAARRKASSVFAEDTAHVEYFLEHGEWPSAESDEDSDVN